MSRSSPSKHRHDGTSPLPLGMDWCPPKLDGRDTPLTCDHAAWSYHVTIPSWVFLPKSRDSDPVVFYKVQVGIQSPEGLTNSRGILKRFSDFTRLFADLKKMHPKRNLPAPPPKGILRKKSRALIEERRFLLEQWVGKLLSDIDISRCITMASFLELEASARYYFQDFDGRTSSHLHFSSGVNGSIQLHPSSSLSLAGASSSVASDRDSEIAYETSELDTPSIGRDTSSEVGTEDLTFDGLTNSIQNFVKYGISNIDEGLLMGETLMEQLGRIPRTELHNRNANSFMLNDPDNKRVPRDALGSATGGLQIFSEHICSNGTAKSSTLQSGSLISSVKSGQVSNSKNLSPVSDVSCGTLDGAEGLSVTEVMGNAGLQSRGGAGADLSFEQEHKVNRVLMSMQQRLITAKADMEDILARLNQEVAVKEYLITKARDLEVELEATKQKSKENLHQAMLLERERVTEMQWDMEDLRRKSLELELRLKSKKVEDMPIDQREAISSSEKDEMQQHLEEVREQLKNVLLKHAELEAKSKSDVKVLVKEVKLLRSSQADLKQDLSQLLQAKSEAESQLCKEKQLNEHSKSSRRMMLMKWRSLWQLLQECNIRIPSEDEDKMVSAFSNQQEGSDMVSATENKLRLILAEAEGTTDNAHDEEYVGEATNQSDEDIELMNMLKEMFEDNVQLRRHLYQIFIQMQGVDGVSFSPTLV